jgi:hypothetical protein
LQQVTDANKSTGPPGELPIETQRAIVVGLIQTGAIRFNDGNADEGDKKAPSASA